MWKRAIISTLARITSTASIARCGHQWSNYGNFLCVSHGRLLFLTVLLSFFFACFTSLLTLLFLHYCTVCICVAALLVRIKIHIRKRSHNIWRAIVSLENFFWTPTQRPLQKSHFGEQNLFAQQCQYIVTLANCNKTSIKKSSGHHRNCSPLNRPTPDFIQQFGHFVKYSNLDFVNTWNCNLAIHGRI